jgi:hypothetical protein
MLKTALTCAAMLVCANAAFAVSPPAETASGLVLHSTLESLTGEKSGIVVPAADVTPGQTFAITGACLASIPSADNVRVVLTLADSAGIEPGYRSVIATDQEMRAGSLHVRVPNMPESANRIFLVKVFRLGQDTPEICDAGTIRIGAAAHGKFG